MELHQLRYLVAVAETGSFTRASERNHISQPSLSQQIIKLERELDHKLFHRLGRRAVPTEVGAVFLERARRILAEVDGTLRELRDDPHAMRRITVGATPTIAPAELQMRAQYRAVPYRARTKLSRQRMQHLDSTPGVTKYSNRGYHGRLCQPSV